MITSISWSVFVVDPVGDEEGNDEHSRDQIVEFVKKRSTLRSIPEFSKEVGIVEQEGTEDVAEPADHTENKDRVSKYSDYDD